MIASTQITDTEIFTFIATFIAVLVFEPEKTIETVNK